jgi:outer membrane beta-barrel protein
MTKRIASAFLLTLTVSVAAPTVAHAQRRSPLADAPAIRKRVELRQSRFELGAGIGSTVNETFYHGVLADVHLGFHITDWLSVSALGTFNVSSIATGFNDQLGSKLSDPGVGRVPGKTEARAGMNKEASIIGGRVEVTPFTGKFSLFGNLFAHYDFYVFGGAALVNLKAVNANANVVSCSDSISQTSSTCVVSGSKVGGMGGVGFHSFFNNYLALSVELRDLLFKDNPAGRGVVVTGVIPGGQPEVSNKDLTWSSHVMAIIGLTVFFPTTASISP